MIFVVMDIFDHINLSIDVDRLTPGTQRKLFEDIVDKEVDKSQYFCM